MSPLQLFRFVFFICSTFIGVSVAYALAYCPKPNGVALRTVAYQDLSPLFAELGTRFGSTEKFLVIAKVPPEIQLESRFVEIENKEARPLILKSPEFEEGAQSVAKDTGISIEAAREEFLKHLMKPRKTESSVSQNGLLYLYSNDLPTLKKFSSEIATDQGLVVEGTKDEIGKLLAGVEGKNSEWWRSNFSKDIDTVMTIGFDAPTALPGSIKRDSKLLRVASWDVATQTKLSTLRGLFDVTPTKAAVLNLFPLAAEQATPWDFSGSRAQSYTKNGQNFKKEYERLGYTVEHVGVGATVESTLDLMKTTVAKGKKVLILAESLIDADGKALMRVPGMRGGISSDDLLKLDDKTLSEILIVSCNSQALSGKLPLSIIGTIYTDTASKLVRATFAAGQADSMTEYLQMGLDSSKDWFPTVARESDRMSTQSGSSSTEQATGFKPVATISRMVRPVVPEASTKDALAEQESSRSNKEDDLYVGVKLFLLGVLGALCKEGLRWKALVEKKKARSYFRGVYLVVSMGLVLAAGFVATVFAQLVPSPQWMMAVAFVAGAGFDKIVQLAAQLEIWNPLRAVPMGGDHASVKHAVDEDEGVLQYLRH